MTTPEEESLQLLGGQFDAFVTMDVYGDPETAVPVFKVGSSDFYFAVSKSRPDLLIELDAAMNRIQDENKYYNQQLHEKYLKSSTRTGTSATTRRNGLPGTARSGWAIRTTISLFAPRIPRNGRADRRPEGLPGLRLHGLEERPAGF